MPNSNQINELAIITSQAFSLVNFRGPLIKKLVNMGVRVHALAPDFSEDTWVNVTRLGAIPVHYSLVRTGMKPMRDLADLLSLILLLKRIGPDATLGYFIKPVIYGSIAAKLAGVRRQFSMIEGLGYVFSSNENLEPFSRRMMRTSVRHMYRLALRFNERVFFLNQDDLEEFWGQGQVRTEQIVRLDGIGLDLVHFALSATVTEPITFLFIGRLLREKGVCEFMEAASQIKARHPEVQCIVVGGIDPNPGSLTEVEMRPWISERTVEWAGQVADVRPWISRASVFVLPSYYREGMPRSIMEAMAMGRPVITTDSPGCRETVKDGLNGFLIPAKNVKALTRAMERFIKEPRLIPQMGLVSRQIAVDRYDVEKANAAILEAMGFLSAKQM